MGKKGLIFKW